MPIWNEELQQWGFLYYEEVPKYEWLGISREFKMDEFTAQGASNLSAPYYDQPKQMVSVSMKQRIEAAIAQAERRLEDVKRMKALLDKNPDLEELLNLMNRNGV